MLYYYAAQAYAIEAEHKGGAWQETNRHILASNIILSEKSLTAKGVARVLSALGLTKNADYSGKVTVSGTWPEYAVKYRRNNQPVMLIVVGMQPIGKGA